MYVCMVYCKVSNICISHVQILGRPSGGPWPCYIRTAVPIYCVLVLQYACTRNMDVHWCTPIDGAPYSCGTLRGKAIRCYWPPAGRPCGLGAAAPPAISDRHAPPQRPGGLTPVLAVLLVPYRTHGHSRIPRISSSRPCPLAVNLLFDSVLALLRRCRFVFLALRCVVRFIASRQSFVLPRRSFFVTRFLPLASPPICRCCARR